MVTNNFVQTHGIFEIISLENGREVWRSPVMQNRILNAGLANIADHHAGDAAVPLAITSLEIGTGTAAVAGTNTALDTLALAGIEVAKIAATGASVAIEFFIIDSELADGTYTELGLRTGSILHTRALFSNPYVKVAGRDTIIRYTVSYLAV